MRVGEKWVDGIQRKESVFGQFLLCFSSSTDLGRNRKKKLDFVNTPEEILWLVEKKIAGVFRGGITVLQ